MTQYLLSVWHSDRNPIPDDPAVMQRAYKQVDAFNADLQASGAWVFGGGLHAPESATVVRAEEGSDPVMTDGPFAETKEQLGGFWVLEAADLDAALALAARASTACMGPVEVRPFQEEPPQDSSR
jgi:hypothetical protein